MSPTPVRSLPPSDPSGSSLGPRTGPVTGKGSKTFLSGEWWSGPRSRPQTGSSGRAALNSFGGVHTRLRSHGHSPPPHTHLPPRGARTPCTSTRGDGDCGGAGRRGSYTDAGPAPAEEARRPAHVDVRPDGLRDAVGDEVDAGQVTPTPPQPRPVLDGGADEAHTADGHSFTRGPETKGTERPGKEEGREGREEGGRGRALGGRRRTSLRQGPGCQTWEDRTTYVSGGVSLEALPSPPDGAKPRPRTVSRSYVVHDRRL